MSENALEAEIIAKKRKSRTVGKNLILPSYKIIVGRSMLGQNAEQEVENVPLWDSRVSRCIDDTPHNSEEVFM